MTQVFVCVCFFKSVLALSDKCRLVFISRNRSQAFRIKWDFDIDTLNLYLCINNKRIIGQTTHFEISNNVYMYGYVESVYALFKESLFSSKTASLEKYT